VALAFCGGAVNGSEKHEHGSISVCCPILDAHACDGMVSVAVIFVLIFSQNGNKHVKLKQKLFEVGPHADSMTVVFYRNVNTYVQTQPN